MATPITSILQKTMYLQYLSMTDPSTLGNKPKQKIACHKMATRTDSWPVMTLPSYRELREQLTLHTNLFPSMTETKRIKETHILSHRTEPPGLVLTG